MSFEPEPERGGRAGAVCVCMYPRGAEEMETDESRQRDKANGWNSAILTGRQPVLATANIHRKRKGMRV